MLLEAGSDATACTRSGYAGTVWAYAAEHDPLAAQANVAPAKADLEKMMMAKSGFAMTLNNSTVGYGCIRDV